MYVVYRRTRDGFVHKFSKHYPRASSNYWSDVLTGTQCIWVIPGTIDPTE